MISDSYLKAKVEEIYLSEPSPPTRHQLITRLYDFFKMTASEGEEPQSFSEKLANSYYTELMIEYKQDDKDFQEVLLTDRNDRFELFKYRYSNGNSSSFIICYCSNFQRECISQSKFIFIDGTFSITPMNFAQVIVILGQTSNMNVPLAYLLLPDKKQDTYEKAFSMFKAEAKASFYTGATFITDFEKAEFKAVKKCLMDDSHYLQLCYFHFCQIFRRYFQKNPIPESLNDLKSIAYLLPFISETKVINVINDLYRFEATRKFAHDFEKKILNKYAFDDWSVYSKPFKETITNNVAESHNNLLSARMGEHPSLQKFEAKLVEIEKEYYYRYENRKYTTPETMRIDEDTFDEMFRKFMANLRRFDSDKTEQHNDLASDLEWFKNTDNEENNDVKILSSDDSLIEIDHNKLDDINNSNEEKITINTESSNENEVEDYIEKEVSNAEKNPKQKITKGNTRKLSQNGKQILLKNLNDFNQAPPRSFERKQIIENTFKDLQDIDQNIDKIQIRSWFSNNKKKNS